MKRILIIGPGASGKSTLARQLGALTGLRVIELDKIFWQQGLKETPRNQWVDTQRKLVAERDWIMDGDLGPYDDIDIRLRAADTIIFLDFAFIRCAWRAIKRSRERLDFWRWLFQYRRRSRPVLLKAIQAHAPTAALHRLRNPNEVQQFLDEMFLR